MVIVYYILCKKFLSFFYFHYMEIEEIKKLKKTYLDLFVKSVTSNAI
jgi:hypothetical protein